MPVTTLALYDPMLRPNPPILRQGLYVPIDSTSSDAHADGVASVDANLEVLRYRHAQFAQPMACAHVGPKPQLQPAEQAPSFLTIQQAPSCLAPVLAPVLATAVTIPTSIATPIASAVAQVIIPYRVVITTYSNKSPQQAVKDFEKGLASIKGNQPSVGKYVTSMRTPELEKAKQFFAHNLPDYSDEFNRLLASYDFTADKYNSANQDIQKKLGYVPNGTTMLQHMRYCIVLAMVELHAKSLTDFLDASGAGAVPEATVAKEVNEFLDGINKEFESYVQTTDDGRKTSYNGIRKGPFAYSMNLFRGGPARTFARAFEVFGNVCSDINSALIIFENGENSRIRSWLKRAAAHRNTDTIKHALDEFLEVADELYETEFRIMEPALKRQRKLTTDALTDTDSDTTADAPPIDADVQATVDALIEATVAAHAIPY